jgi:hypothetical protein
VKEAYIDFWERINYDLKSIFYDIEETYYTEDGIVSRLRFCKYHFLSFLYFLVAPYSLVEKRNSIARRSFQIRGLSRNSVGSYPRFPRKYMNIRGQGYAPSPAFIIDPERACK